MLVPEACKRGVCGLLPSACRIDDCLIGLDEGAGGQASWFHAIGCHEVKHGFAARDQVVGDNPPMTAPPHSFRAHDGAASEAAQGDEPIKAGAELYDTACGTDSSAASGTSIVKTQPLPGRLRMRISPPCARTAFRAIESPRPRPDRSLPRRSPKT